MLVGHSVSDADGNILTMDQAVSDMLQRPVAELRGVPFTNFTHPDDVRRNVAEVERLEVRGGPLALRKRYIRPDGSSVWCDVHISRFVAGEEGRLVGTIHRVHAIARDRSPRGLWQEALRIQQTMRERRQELGDDLFADHAWAIMLQTYIAEAEGRLIDAAAIGAAIAIGAPMVERWLNALVARRYVERPAWNAHAVQLTPTGLAKVEALLAPAVGVLSLVTDR